MVLVIGGAYQGKLDYAKSAFGITDREVYTCTNVNIDFSRRCIYAIEEFTLACVHSGFDAVQYFETCHDEWQDSILICQDITCGVVPLGRDMRTWRDVTGKLCQYLAGEAKQVSRIFCGLEQKLK